MSHSSKSRRSRAKSVRFPNAVWAEVAATAEKNGRTFNEEVIARVAAGADPHWSPTPDERQVTIFEALSEVRGGDFDE